MTRRNSTDTCGCAIRQSGGSATATDWYPAIDDTTFSDQWGFDRYLEISGGQLTVDGATATPRYDLCRAV